MRGSHRLCRIQGVNFQAGSTTAHRLSEGRVMSTVEYPCGPVRAGHIKHAIHVLGWTQARASQEFAVNGGTVSKIARGKRYRKVPPLPF